MLEVVEMGSRNGVVDGVQEVGAGRVDEELQCNVGPSRRHYYKELEVSDFWRREPERRVVGIRVLTVELGVVEELP